MSKQWVIPYIHDWTQVLIETQIVPSKDDRIFFLGDFAHLAPIQGACLIMLWGQQQGYQVVALKGKPRGVFCQSMGRRKGVKKLYGLPVVQQVQTTVA